MAGQKWVVNSEHTKEMFIRHIEKLYEEHKHVTFSFTTGKQRTQTQNAALHLYLRMLSEALNDAGMDMKATLNEGVDIPWNEAQAKEYLWKPIQKAITGKNSTKDPKRTEYVEIYETLNRLTAEKFGISVPWPCKDEM